MLQENRSSGLRARSHGLMVGRQERERERPTERKLPPLSCTARASFLLSSSRTLPLGGKPMRTWLYDPYHTTETAHLQCRSVRFLFLQDDNNDKSLLFCLPSAPTLIWNQTRSGVVRAPFSPLCPSPRCRRRRRFLSRTSSALDGVAEQPQPLMSLRLGLAR